MGSPARRTRRIAPRHTASHRTHRTTTPYTTDFSPNPSACTARNYQNSASATDPADTGVRTRA